jgi:hypothetical protein
VDFIATKEDDLAIETDKFMTLEGPRTAQIHRLNFSSWLRLFGETNSR